MLFASNQQMTFKVKDYLAKKIRLTNFVFLGLLSPRRLPSAVAFTAQDALSWERQSATSPLLQNLLCAQTFLFQSAKKQIKV